jgi:hypothetical protein
MAKSKRKGKDNVPVVNSEGKLGTEPLSSFQETEKTGRKDQLIEEKPIIPNNKNVVITLEAASIQKNDTLKVSYSKVELDGAFSYHNGEEFDRIIHPDLRQCFNDLAIHWAFLTTFLERKKYHSLDKITPEIVKPFKCKGVSIKPETGFQLIGYKIDDDGYAINLNTPYRLFEVDEKKAYRFMEELQEVFQRLDKEVIAYILGIKKGDSREGELPFAGTDNSKEAEVGEEEESE